MKTAALLKLNSPWKEVDGVPIVHHHFSPCFDRHYSSAKQGCYNIALSDDSDSRKRTPSPIVMEDRGVLSEQTRSTVPYKYSNRPSQCLRGSVESKNLVERIQK
jgi:hypothetical protein